MRSNSTFAKWPKLDGLEPTNPGWHRGTEICPALPANIQALGQLFLELRLLVRSSTGVGHIVPMFLSYCCFIHTWSADCCVSMVYEPREPTDRSARRRPLWMTLFPPLHARSDVHRHGWMVYINRFIFATCRIMSHRCNWRCFCMGYRQNK